ncbi:MFS transporter [Halalkalibacterium halodurans]|nr:MFS transporter [Halalkalibacterium halodurans]
MEERFLMTKSEHAPESKSVKVVALVTALCLLGDSLLYVALPIYYREVGLQSLWEVGIILSLNRFVRIPINPLVGKCYQHVTLRTGLLIAVSLTLVTTIGYGVGYGFFVWVILRLLWGIAWSFLRLGGLFTVLEEATDSNRGKLMGQYNGLYRLGSLGGMLGGGILASFIGLSATAIIFGVLAVLAIPYVLRYVPSLAQERTGQPEGDSTEKKRKGLYGRHAILAISSGLLLALFLQGLFGSTLSLLMLEHYGETIYIVGMIVGVTALSGVLQGVRWVWEPFLAVLFGHWSDGDRGRLPLFILFLIMTALGYGAMVLSLPLIIWLAAVIVVMVASTALTTLIDALTSDVAKGQDANRVMTSYTVFLDVGAALGPLLAYFLLDIGLSLTFVYLSSAVIFLLLAVQWGWCYLRDPFYRHDSMRKAV